MLRRGVFARRKKMLGITNYFVFLTSGILLNIMNVGIIVICGGIIIPIKAVKNNNSLPLKGIRANE
jgi:hypothetical protein